MRIAHLSSEMSPFARSGGLGDVVGSLPQALARLGHDVWSFVPLYREARCSLERLHLPLEEATAPFDVALGETLHRVGIVRATLPGSPVTTYFVGCDPLFDRPSLYAPAPSGQDDGLERFAVFCRASLEAMRRLGRVPDVLHTHDWQTALAPVDLALDRTPGSPFAGTATVHTVHNLSYQGVYPLRRFSGLGLPPALVDGFEWRGDLNLLKAALLSADAITAVSPTFAFEITTPEGGFGLDRLLRERHNTLLGILNGIDHEEWDPTHDPSLPAPFRSDELAGKREDRRALLARAGMDPDDPGMVVGIVGRLTYQKGYDLLFPVLDDLITNGIRFVVLGAGDPEIVTRLRGWNRLHPQRLWASVGMFDDALARLIYAGSDAFLMPSRFEPCGLGQLYALAYGTPPIVRRVGGLADTVTGFNGSNSEFATGFVFDSADPLALRAAVRAADAAHRDPGLWARLVQNGMEKDFSWARSAERYLSLYRVVLATRSGPL